MRKIRHRPGFSDDNPFTLNKEEQKKLDALNLEVSAAQQKIIVFRREVARGRGIISATLEGLKSKSGKRFVQEKLEKSWSSDYMRAAVMEDSLPGFALAVVEMAYLCRSMDYPINLQENPDGCGWVKGNPVEKEYNDIGVLSGSAYYCKICGIQIGELQPRKSLR